jgi:hypothetical protein
LLKKKNGAVAKEGAAWLVLSNQEQRKLTATRWPTDDPSSDDQTQFTTICAVHAAVVPKAEAASTETTVDKVIEEEDDDDVVVLDEKAADDEPSSSRAKLDDDEKPLTLVDGSRFQLFCQPGNLGLLEEWVQLEQIVNADDDDDTATVTCIVNGALDAVRDGLYPAKYFPELTNTIPCYQKFTPVLIAKPIVVKGGGYMGWVPDDVYGWLFRVYPEPWQVYLQTARWEFFSKETRVPPKRIVENRIVMVTETRPNDADCLRPLMVVRDVNKIRYRPL